MKRRTKIERIREVVNILLEHGLVDFIRELGLTSFVSRDKMESQLEKRMKEVNAEDLRYLFEDLGPAFIKLGQFLGMRPDLVPPEFAKELQKLYDEATPFSPDVARKIIEEELGDDLENIFDEFYNEPLAAGSIGQVHEAVLKNGKEVVVKVQRPNIHQKVQADMELIERFAGILEDIYPESEIYHPKDTILEFKKMLRAEMDYTVEARNAQRFHEAFKDEPQTIIPKVEWDYLTDKVLILDNIDSKSIRLAMDKNYSPEFNKEMATKLARSMMRQFFIHGIFHADPSPGNIHFTEEGNIVFLDFGAIGRLTEDIRDEMIEMFIAMFRENTEKVTEHFLSIGEIRGDFDKEELMWDIENVIELYKRKPDMMVKEGMNDEIMNIAKNHNITLPADFLLMERALLETEGICKTLDPDFDFFKASEPVIEEILLNKYSPKSQIMDVFDSLKDYKELFMNFPKRADSVMENIEKGEMKIDIEVEGLSELEHELDVVSNRLSFTIIAASIIIGSALLVLASGENLFAPYIFLVSVLIGIWLLITIVKRGKY